MNRGAAQKKPSRLKVLALMAILIGAGGFLLTKPGQRVILRIKLNIGPYGTRKHAVTALQAHGRQGVPLLAEALYDPDDRIHFRALATLKEMGPIAAEATPAMLDCAGHPEQDSKAPGNLIATGINNGKETPFYGPSRHEQLRDAIVALKNISALVRLLQKPKASSDQRLLALEALSLLLALEEDQPLPEGFVDALFSDLGSRSKAEFEATLQVLRRLLLHREESFGNTTVLAEGLNSPNATIRARSFRCLRRFPTSAMTPALAPKLAAFIDAHPGEASADILAAADLLAILAPKETTLETLYQLLGKTRPEQGSELRETIGRLEAKLRKSPNDK